MKPQILKETSTNFEYAYDNKVLYSLCGVITSFIFIISLVAIITTPVYWGLLFIPIGLLIFFLLFFMPKTFFSINVNTKTFEKRRVLRILGRVKITNIPLDQVDKVDVFEIGDTKNLMVWLKDMEMIKIYHTSKVKLMDEIFKKIAYYIDKVQRIV